MLTTRSSSGLTNGKYSWNSYHLNGLHNNIKFTIEIEEGGHLPFLDIDIYRKTDGSLGHKVYVKPTHTTLYLHQLSHHHPANKHLVLSSLIHRAKTLCDQDSLEQELSFLTTVFKNNGYSQQHIRRAIFSARRIAKCNEKPTATVYIPYTATTYGRLSEKSESEDELEICDYQSGTEQSGFESEDELPLYDRLCTIVGKGGTAKWETIPPRQNSRTRIHNIVTHLLGVKSAAKRAATPTEAWKTFFTEEILQLIVEYTNLEFQYIRGNYSRERNANPTNIVELKALIGLLFLAGLLRSYHVNSKLMGNGWNRDRNISTCIVEAEIQVSS